MKTIISKKAVSFTELVNGKNRKVLVTKADSPKLYANLVYNRDILDYNRLKEFVKYSKYYKVVKRTPQYYYIVHI